MQVALPVSSAQTTVPAAVLTLMRDNMARVNMWT